MTTEGSEYPPSLLPRGNGGVNPRSGCYAMGSPIWGFSSVGRALPWHGRGQGFDSPKLHAVRWQSHLTNRVSTSSKHRDRTPFGGRATSLTEFRPHQTSRPHAVRWQSHLTNRVSTSSKHRGVAAVRWQSHLTNRVSTSSKHRGVAAVRWQSHLTNRVSTSSNIATARRSVAEKTALGGTGAWSEVRLEHVDSTWLVPRRRRPS